MLLIFGSANVYISLEIMQCFQQKIPFHCLINLMQALKLLFRFDKIGLFNGQKLNKQHVCPLG